MTNRGRGATRKSSQYGMHPFALLATGFVAGCFVSFLVYLGGVDDEKPAPPVAKKAAPKQPAETTTATKFDFFTLLPEREVIVPEDEPEMGAGSATGTATQPPTPTQPAVQYILQAGSFKNAGDADRRRAQLILLGMEAKVETVKAAGDTWHRVYVGPFSSSSMVSKARATLISEGIDTLLLKRKADT